MGVFILTPNPDGTIPIREELNRLFLAWQNDITDTRAFGFMRSALCGDARKLLLARTPTDIAFSDFYRMYFNIISTYVHSEHDHDVLYRMSGLTHTLSLTRALVHHCTEPDEQYVLATFFLEARWFDAIEEWTGHCLPVFERNVVSVASLLFGKAWADEHMKVVADDWARNYYRITEDKPAFCYEPLPLAERTAFYRAEYAHYYGKKEFTVFVRDRYMLRAAANAAVPDTDISVDVHLLISLLQNDTDKGRTALRNQLLLLIEKANAWPQYLQDPSSRTTVGACLCMLAVDIEQKSSSQDTGTVVRRARLKNALQCLVPLEAVLPESNLIRYTAATLFGDVWADLYAGDLTSSSDVIRIVNESVPTWCQQVQSIQNAQCASDLPDDLIL